MTVSVVAGATVLHAEDALKVAVSRRGSWETAVAEIGTRAGIFKKHNLSLDITYPTPPSSSPSKVVFSGEADIGVGVATASAMWLFAKGEPVRVVGSARMRSNDLYWYVKADGPMESIKEATDKTTIAYDREASFTHTHVLGFIKVYGLKSRPPKSAMSGARLPP
jgi:NitT/TauT family transport system substrate-binding protein